MRFVGQSEIRSRHVRDAGALTTCVGDKHAGDSECQQIQQLCNSYLKIKFITLKESIK